MNAPVTRRALLGATAAVGAMSLPAVAEAGITASDPDAGLFRLLDGLTALEARRAAVEVRQDALWAEFAAQEPERPHALRVRTADGFNVSQCQERTRDGAWFWFYEAPAGYELEALPVPECDERRDGRWVAVPDGARIARRAEIVAALDAWEGERDEVKVRLGIPAVDDEAESACDALHQAWDAILETVPQTFAGLAAKARWATAADVPTGLAERWERRIAADVVELAGRGGAAS